MAIYIFKLSTQFIRPFVESFISFAFNFCNILPILGISPWSKIQPMKTFYHCVGMVSLKRLIINSDSPATCLIEERNQSTSHWCHSTKNMPRFEFSVSLFLCLLFSLFYESACAYPKAPLWICVYIWVYWMCLYVPNKGLCSAFIRQHRRKHMGNGMRNTLQKSLTHLSKGLCHWLQINYEHHCLSSNICCVQHLWYKITCNL